jgi:hypothetical protein
MKKILNTSNINRDLIIYITCLAILIFASVGQLSVIILDFVIPHVEQIWMNRNLDMMQRSAFFFLGPDFQGYIEFLRGNIPEDSKVIIPPHSVYSPFAHVGLMQYFLFPRDIHNCGVDEVEECVQRVQDSDWYILSVQRFPPKDIASQTKQRIMYDSKLGLFVPEPVND